MLSKPLSPPPTSASAPTSTKRPSAHRIPMPKRIRDAVLALKGLNYKVAIDVEHTGGAAGLGNTFALAIVVSMRGADGKWRIVQRCTISYNPLTQGERDELARIRANPETDTVPIREAFFQTVWADHKWDKATFDEFWIKNLDMFEKLLAAATHPTQEAFNAAVSKTLGAIERECLQPGLGNTIEYVWDTMHVDPVRCNLILEHNNGELGMNYYRNGRYGCQSTYLRSVVTGMVAGALGLQVDEIDYKIFVSPVMAKLRAYANLYTAHSHDPTEDAEHILWMYIYAPEAVAEFVAELKAEAAKEAADQIALDGARKYWRKYNHGHYVVLQSMDDPALTLDSYHSMYAAVEIISRYLDVANAETPSLPADAPPRSVAIIEGDHQEVYKLAEAAALTLQIKYPEWIFYIAQGGGAFEYTGVRALERRNEPHCELCDWVAHQQASPLPDAAEVQTYKALIADGTDKLLRGTLIADVLADGGAAEDAARAETESAIRAIVELN